MENNLIYDQKRSYMIDNDQKMIYNDHMSSGMIPAERQDSIVNYLKKKGFAQVDELSRLLDVSAITIRRDLDLLEKKGTLERSHGGARYRNFLLKESLYEEKGREQLTEKSAIAQMAAQLVQSGETLFLNSGSTTRLVMAALEERNDLRIVTNNLAAVQTLQSTHGPEILVPGGYYRRQSQCLVGAETLDYLGRVYGDRVIMGTDGLSLEGGLTSPVSQEAAVTRAMVQQCQGEVIVVTDSTKIGRISHFKTIELDRIDLVITDSNIDRILKEELEAAGLKIRLI
jgi:DeoR family transcriptional regulator of aga operon